MRRECLVRRNSAKDIMMAFDPTLPRDTARILRANQTEAEQKLWSRLRKKQLLGFSFSKQYPIGPYFADFVCVEARLIIEVDGSQHADQEERDDARSEFLRGAGYTVLRFWNYEVSGEIDHVVDRIHDMLEKTPRSVKRKRL